MYVVDRVDGKEFFVMFGNGCFELSSWRIMRKGKERRMV